MRFAPQHILPHCWGCCLERSVHGGVAASPAPVGRRRRRSVIFESPGLAGLGKVVRFATVITQLVLRAVALVLLDRVLLGSVRGPVLLRGCVWPARSAKVSGRVCLVVLLCWRG
jgi:hypothetical protein